MKVLAAKDLGDAKGDKSRKQSLAALASQASEIAEGMDLSGFPEVAEAVKAVQSLAEMSSKMEEHAQALKDAPRDSDAAESAQTALARARSSADGVVPSVAATLTTMRNILLLAAELEADQQKIEAQLEGLKKSIVKEKERLASAARAVQNLAKLG